MTPKSGATNIGAWIVWQAGENEKLRVGFSICLLRPNSGGDVKRERGTIKFDSGAVIFEDEFDHHPSPQADKHLFAVSMCVTTTNRLGWHTANKKRALWHKWEKTEIELH
jgi:hypothetical protein